MKNYIAFYGLRPGDEIIVPKSSLNIIQHHALYLGYDHKGVDWIIHNNPNNTISGVTVMRANDFFSQCRQINQIVRFRGTNLQRLQLIQRSLAKIGQPYDLIDYNCEHFVTEIKTGKAQSKQVEMFLLLTITVTILGVGMLLGKSKYSR